MRLRTVAIGVASVAWLLAVELSPSAQAPAPPAAVAPIKRTGAGGRGRSRAPVTPAGAGGEAASAPTIRRPAAAFRRRRTSLFKYTCGECHNSTELAGGLDVALYSSPDSLTDRSGALGADPREAQVRRDAAARTSSGRKPKSRRWSRSSRPSSRAPTRACARSRTRHGATAEPRRVHEHDPRSARHRVPRRQEFPHRRFGRRLRQHRRDPDRVADPDGEVPVGRGADRRTGDCHGQAARSRSRSSTASASRACGGSIRATSRRRTASTSTPTTS